MNNIYEPNFAAYALANRCDIVNPEFAETVRKSIVNADCWRRIEERDRLRRVFNHLSNYSRNFANDPSL